MAVADPTHSQTRLHPLFHRAPSISSIYEPFGIEFQGVIVELVGCSRDVSHKLGGVATVRISQPL